MNAKELYNSVENIDEYLKPYHVYLKKYDDERLLFLSNLRDTSVPYHWIRSEFKGMVIDTITNKVICRHTKPHRYFNEVSIGNNRYKAFLAEDGTQVALYFFDGVLAMGTNKSVDVTEFKWHGEQSMSELFYECMLNYPEFVSKTNFRSNNRSLAWNLPTEYSISIGFHHQKIHPSSAGKKLWFIGCVDNESGYELSLEEIASNEKLAPLLLLPRNVEIPTHNISFEKCMRSVEINKKDKFYGYILDVENVGKVFMPSSYYSLISSIFYAHNADTDIIYTNRYKHQIIYNILSNNIEGIEQIVDLSPDFKTTVEKVMADLNQIIVYVKMMIENGIACENKYRRIVTCVIDDIMDNEPDILKNTPHIVKVITDYLYNNKYTKLVLDL